MVFVFGNQTRPDMCATKTRFLQFSTLERQSRSSKTYKKISKQRSTFRLNSVCQSVRMYVKLYINKTTVNIIESPLKSKMNASNPTDLLFSEIELFNKQTFHYLYKHLDTSKKVSVAHPQFSWTKTLIQHFLKKL